MVCLFFIHWRHSTWRRHDEVILIRIVKKEQQWVFFLSALVDLGPWIT
jgi:hypothetical protein